MRDKTYRGYHITASAYYGFDFEAEDYDGPEDGRCGHADTEAEAKAAIDEIEGCDHDWERIQGWGGDASVYMGTFDASFYRCKKCGDEQNDEPDGYLQDDDPRPRGILALRNPEYPEGEEL